MSRSEWDSLQRWNSFGVDARCRRLSHVDSPDALKHFIESDPDIFILGGGSNMLVIEDVDKHILRMDIPGINLLDETSDHVYIRAGAGVNWHDLVLWSLDQGYGGIENLSLIPGTVGASPIQNIGAYGVELADVFDSLVAFDTKSHQVLRLSREECQFAYRSSIFKTEEKGRFIILQVILRLTKRRHHINTSYGAISGALETKGIVRASPRDVSKAVIEIRQSKLPDPKQLGNSGSFFKNPILAKEEFDQLREMHPHVPYFELEDGRYKIPAGWLIDQSGWKGYKRENGAGVYHRQALVLVNHGGASGADIWQLALDIRSDVYQKWRILLEPEVNIIGAGGVVDFRDM